MDCATSCEDPDPFTDNPHQSRTCGHNVVCIGGPTGGIVVAGRCDIFIPFSRMTTVVTMSFPFLSGCRYQTGHPMILHRQPPSYGLVFNITTDDDLGEETSTAPVQSTSPTSASTYSSVSTTSRKRVLFDTNVKSPTGAQDSPLDLGHPHKNTDLVMLISNESLNSSVTVRLCVLICHPGFRKSNDGVVQSVWSPITVVVA